jgi:hypothetical protein
VKYVARVARVLKSIHTVGSIVDNELAKGQQMGRPDYVEIEPEGGPDEPCMMFRYTDAGEFCGDTWHQTFADAIHQAEYEYGLTRQDFKPVGAN